LKWVQAHESRDCGAACLATVAMCYGTRLDVSCVAALAQTTRQGARLDQLRDAAHTLGFAASCGKIREGILNALPVPAILHLHKHEGDHYVVLLKVRSDGMVVADPTVGVVRVPASEVLREFSGFVLLLRPTNRFRVLSKRYRGRHPWTVTWNVLKENGKWFVMASGAALLAASTSVVVPLFIGNLIDRDSYAKVSADSAALTVTLFVSVAAAQSVFAVLKQLCIAMLSVQVEGRYLSRFMRRLPRLPLSFFDRFHPGDLISRVSDVIQLRLALTGPILSLQMDVAYLIVSAILLARMSGFLLFVGLATVVTSFGLQGLARRHEVVSFRIMRARMTELTGLIIEMITGIRVLKSYVREDEHLAKLEERHGAALTALRNSNVLAGLTAGGSLLITGLGIAALIAGAQRLISMNRLTPGQLTYLVAVGSVMIGASGTISDALTTCENVAVNVERLMQTDTVPVEPRPTDSVESKDLIRDQCLELNDVSFSFDGGTVVFDKLSFSVPYGDVVGIRGHSGSGKSTLALLCNGLYRPSAGDIRICGRSLNQWDLGLLRKRVCILFSEGNLISGTVRNNIALDAEMSEEDVRDAAKMACAHDFICDLPGGYSYRLGHMGEGLSSGQRQRIALARAFLLHPEILILDEAMSNLDIDLEREILLRLLKSRQGLTTVIISHRPETMRYAGKIFELANGKVSLLEGMYVAYSGSLPSAPEAGIDGTIRR
jgi:ABC-type bacteriocin/lantibiotic exporter with double-glycine peptidase domain